MAKPIHILLIEDSEDDALLLRNELQRGGFEPTICRVETKRALLEALEKQPWDIILADYVIPGFGGRQALETFKNTGLDIPFIIVSGKIGEETAVEAMRSGAQDYILKNSLARLSPAINRELREKNHRAQRRQAREALQSAFASLEQRVAERTAELTSANQRLRNEIQQRAAAEEHLQRTKDELELAISGTGAGMWNMAINGETDFEKAANRLRIDSRMKAILGFRDDELSSEGSTWRSRRHPEDRARIDGSATVYLANPQGVWAVEYRILHKDGTYRWISSRGFISKDQEGQPSLWTGLVWDITEQKEAAIRLADNARRLELAISGLHGGIAEYEYRVDAATGDLADNVYLDPNLKAMLGYSNGDFPDTLSALTSRLHPEDLHIIPDAFNSAVRDLERDIFEWQVRALHRDGAYRWVQVRSTVLRNERKEPLRWLALVWDITDQKRTEEQLRLSEARMRQQLEEIEFIYRHSGIGLGVMDHDLRWIRINERLAQMNGFPVEEHIGKTVRELLPDLADAAAKIMQPVFETGEPVWNVELTGETPAQPGVTRTWVEHFLPLKDESGNVVAVNLVCEEVTEQKQLEEQLRLVSERFRIALKGSSTTVFSLDKELRYTWIFNQALDVTEEQIIGKTDLDILPNNEGRMLMELKRQVLTTNQPVHQVVALTGTQGQTLYFDSKFEPLLDTTGEVIGVIGAGTDITAARNLAQNLAENTERNHVLLESNPEPIMMHDNGIVVYCNPAYQKLLGASAKDIIGQPAIDWVAPEYHQLIEARIKDVSAGFLLQPIQAALVRTDGSIVDVETTSTPIHVGGQRLALVILHNISEHKRVERELFETAQRLHAHLDNSLLAVTEFDSDMTIIRWGKENERIFGYTAEEMVGRKLPDTQWMHEDDAERVIEVAKGLLDGSRKQVRCINRNYCKDGSVVHMDWYNSAIHDENGRMVTLLSFGRDISDRLQADMALVRAKEQAEKALRELATLNYALDQHAIVAITDHAGTITYVNKKFCEVSKYSSEELVGQNHRIINSGYHPKSFFAQMWKTISSGEVWHGEIRNRAKDGSYYWVDTTIVPFKDDDDKIKQYVAIREDITVRKEAEDVIRNLASFPEENPNPVLRSSIDGKVVYTNRAAAEVLSLLNWQPNDPLPEPLMPGLMSLPKTSGDAETEETEVELTVKDGRVFSFLFTPSATEGNINIYGRDLTERKRAEEALRETERKFRSLAENLPSVLMRYDAQLRVVYLSPQAEKIIGMPVEEFIGKTNREVGMPADLCGLWETAITDVFRTGETRTLEFDFPSPDMKRTFLLKLAPELGPDGTVECVLGISDEISERKRAEEALRRNEERLRVAVEAANLGTWDLDLVNDVAHRSLRHDQIWGYTEPQEEWGLEKAMRYVVPEDRPLITEAYTRGMKEGVLSHENRIIWPDGSVHWIEAYGRFTYDSDGRAIRVTGVVADITERKEAERALRENEDRFRQLANAMPQLVWTADADGRVNYFNDRQKDLEGISPSEDGAYEWAPALHPDDVQATVDAWQRAVVTGEEYQTEHRIRMADGSYRWHLSRGVPVHNELGQVIKWFGTATDIHDMKMSQEAMRLSEDRFRVALQVAEIMVYSMDRNLRYTWVQNPKLGFTVEELVGKTDADILPADIADRLTELRQRPLQTGEPVHEIFSVEYEGENFHFDMTVEPMRDASGRITGIVGSTFDLTREVRQRRALEQTELRFRIALEASKVSVFTQNRELQYVWIYNPQFDLTADDLIGKTDLEVMGEQAGRRLYNVKRRVLMTGESVRQIADIPVDGGTRFMDLVIEPIKEADGSVSGIICSSFDLTDRVVQERELEESESRYRTLFDLSPDGIFMQIDDKIEFANQAFVEMMKADSAAQLVGKSIWGFIRPDFHDIIRERLEVQRTGSRIEPLEEVWVCLDGSEVLVEGNGSPFIWQGKSAVQVVLHDITGRKKAEQALAESEERYRDLVELSPDGVIIEVDGKVAFANKGFVKLVGATSLDQVLERERLEFVHPDLHDVVRARIRAIVEEGAETQPLLQEQFIRLDGSIVDVEAAIAAYTWHGRRAAQIIVRDITERLRAEEAAQEAARRLSAAVNHVPAAFVIYNADRTIAYVNSYATKMIGLPEHEIVGHGSDEINSSPDVVAKYVPPLEKAFETGETQTAEIDGYMRTGHYSVIASYVPMLDAGGRVYQVIAVSYDISKRKQYEQALRESESKLQRAVEIAHLGNWEWDKDSDMLFWSAELRRIFGLEETSGISSALFYDYIHRDDRARVQETFEQAFVTHEPIDVEFRIKRSDGETRHLHAIAEVSESSESAARIFGTVHDITQIRIATSELAESQAKLERASALAQLGHWEFELAGNTVSWSDQLYDIFGLPHDSDVSIDQMAGLMHPDDKAYIAEAIDGVLHHDRPLDLAVRTLRPGGEVRHLHLIGEVTRDAAGRPRRFFGSAQDITERVQAEQAIRESEERFRTLADSAPVFIWISDATTQTAYVNLPWLEFRGRKLEEELGRGWTEGIHPDDLDYALDIYLANFHARRPFEIEYRLQRFDGVYRWILDRGRPRFLPDGTFVGFIGSAIDITERKQTEAELYEAEQRLRTAVNNYPATFVIYDKDRRIEFINRRGVEASGLPEEELIGKRDEEVFPEEVYSAYLPGLLEMVATGQLYSGESHLTLPGGEFYAAATYVPLYDRDGNLRQILGITYDITDRKRAEIELRLAHDELEQRVFERTGELIEANKLLVREVEERTIAEKALRQTTQLLEEERLALERKNIALREIFDQIEAEKNQIKEQLATNIEQAIMPTIQKLKEAPKVAVPKLLELLERDFREITSPFIDLLKNSYEKLSPREIEICRLIKNGMSTKEIAEALNLSPMTVQKHREVVRKKLGLVNVDTNLQTYLQSL